MNHPAPVTLRLTTAEGAVRDVPLAEEMLVLGSGPAAGLRVHDPAVSSLHLLLKQHRDTVLAIDLASEAGTQVGDTPLQVPRALRHEDVIRLGRSRLTVYFGVGPVVGAPARALRPPRLDALRTGPSSARGRGPGHGPGPGRPGPSGPPRRGAARRGRSEERRVGKECRSRWSPY